MNVCKILEYCLYIRNSEPGLKYIVYYTSELWPKQELPRNPFGDVHFLLVMHVFADARPWLHVCVGASKRAVVRARACTQVVRECCGMQAVLCSGRGLQTFAGNIPTGSPSNFLNEIIYIYIYIFNNIIIFDIFRLFPGVSGQIRPGHTLFSHVTALSFVDFNFYNYSQKLFMRARDRNCWCWSAAWFWCYAKIQCKTFFGWGYI